MPSETTEMIALRSDSNSDRSGDGTQMIDDDFQSEMMRVDSSA